MCSKERVSKKRERLDLHNDATASLLELGGPVARGLGGRPPDYSRSVDPTP